MGGSFARLSTSALRRIPSRCYCHRCSAFIHAQDRTRMGTLVLKNVVLSTRWSRYASMRTHCWRMPCERNSYRQRIRNRLSAPDFHQRLCKEGRVFPGWRWNSDTCRARRIREQGPRTVRHHTRRLNRSGRPAAGLTIPTDTMSLNHRLMLAEAYASPEAYEDRCGVAGRERLELVLCRPRTISQSREDKSGGDRG